MKLHPLLLLLSLAVTVDAGAQTEQGSWELSAACNFGSMSTSYESSGGGYSSSGSSDGVTYFALDLRTGYYVTHGLSLEPEIYILGVEDDPPAFSFGANISYAFDIPDSPVKPFVIAGYGIGNAAPIMQRLLGRSSDKMDIPALRVGGGLKIFVVRWAALKMEYRYERYSRETSSGFMTAKSTTNYHNVLFGFSVFLPSGS